MYSISSSGAPQLRTGSENRESSSSSEMQFSSQTTVSKHHRTSPSSHRLLHAMLLLVLLLIVQMPAMVGSRSIPGSTQLHSKSLHEKVHITGDSDSDKKEVQRSLIHNEERRKRGINDPTFWPNKTIPYVFQEPFSTKNKRRVLEAISAWEDSTCIKFVDRTDEEYFARFEINSFTCDSAVGLVQYSMYKDIGQPVKLTKACLKKQGHIIHELGHLIGFYHEHQRPDRDDYIQINYENIAANKYVSQFETYDFETYGPYDFASIMHYPFNYFARAGTDTIQLLPNTTLPEDVVIGPTTLSPLDAEKAELMYQCSNDTLEEPMTEGPPSDNIYAGEQVALTVRGTDGSASFSPDSWLSCTQQQCTVNSCPGNLLADSDKDMCPFNTFTLHKISSGPKAEASSAIVRVGDTIVLEHRDNTQEKSFFVSCDPDTLTCSLSQECTANIDDYETTSFCEDNQLIVRAEGKEEGTPITQTDVVGFEYAVDNPDPFFTQQCTFGCDPATSICTKELCIHVNFNSLDPSDTPNELESPKCGKDVFLIKKFSP